jgi:hypothetical protein
MVLAQRLLLCYYNIHVIEKEIAMLVTPLGPRETINWFEQVDRQHEILCFIITADPEHRRILGKLAQHYIDADAALGTKVAFILFGGENAQSFAEVDFRHGSRLFLPGQLLLPRALRDHANRPHFGSSEHPSFDGLYDYQAKLLEAETAKLADEWMRMMGVKRQSLPVLCALVKGNDPVVISLGDKVDVTIVLKLFGHLADIAERDSEAALALTFNAEVRMKRALELNSEIKLLERSFQEHVDAMCNRFKATSEERQLVAEFLACRPYSAQTLELVLKRCKFADAKDFNSSTTVKGVRNKLNKLTKALLELEERRPQEQLVDSVIEALEAINARRQETARLVQELRMQGLDAQSVTRQSLGVTYDKYAARANQTVTLLEKFVKFFGVAKGVGLLANILK